jgi:ubiquinone/menaquinone biosynthesis C-methylase UbiE
LPFNNHRKTELKTILIAYQFPPIAGSTEKPIWTGSGFMIGEKRLPVLSYQVDPSGWTDELTTFHEENAGSTHFIDMASRRHCLEQLKAHLQLDRQPTILEIGCSSGFMLDAIAQEFPSCDLLGSDIILGPLHQLSRIKPSLPLLHFDITTCPLYDRSVDAVVMLNVLEHILEDELALRQVFRILKPGGILIVEVPAGPDLYDVYDRLLLHYRRYKMRDLLKKARTTGFTVLNKSHLGFFIYPQFWLVKKLRMKIAQKVEQDQLTAIVSRDIQTTKENILLKVVTNFELFFGKWVSYPFGIRCLLTLQKS